MTIAFCSVTLGVSETVGHLAQWTGAMEAWPRKGENTLFTQELLKILRRTDGVNYNNLEVKKNSTAHRFLRNI